MRSTVRCALFWLPLALLFGPPALALWLGGELISADEIVERQSVDRPLILNAPAYTNSAMYVKMRMIDRKRPEVLALGTSRVMQFRAGFFLPETRFYNAGGSVARLMHLRAVLDHIPEKSRPQVLLVALDPYFFNSGFDRLERDIFNVPWLEQQMTQRPSGAEVFAENWWTVWRDISAGKIEWSKLASLRGLHDRLGINSVMNDTGFRNDGSRRYGGTDLDIADPRHRDHNFNGSLKQIAAGRGRFVYGRDIPPAALREVEALLDTCAARRIEVVAFLPPYPHQVWAKMKSMGDKYAYLEKLPPALHPLFDRRGFEFYDFSDFAQLGAPDSEAIDGFHGSERTYLRLLIAMLEQGSRLNRYADLPKLREMLAAAKSHVDLVPEQ